jgi:L-ascorbate metabolism protein UlaG (beta-lactamase superfamily)
MRISGPPTAAVANPSTDDSSFEAAMTLPLTDHFNGKTFFQPHDRKIRLLDFWRWRLTSRPKRWPARVALEPMPPRPVAHGNEVVVTWLGHATFLLESAHGTVLVDPVFSERASPFTWAGPRRVHPPPLAFDALPPIDAVLVSHDHYDHCDAATLRALAARHRGATFIAPLRHRDLLAAAGAENVVELDWWQSRRVRDVTVTLTPAKHWSNRLGTPRNHRLWGGFMIEFPILDSRISNGEPPPREIGNGASKTETGGTRSRRVWFVSDTGYDQELFRRIRDRCGAPDIALVPIGAYEPRWFMAPMHINPAEAVKLHRDVGAHQSIAMHWGTFQLTDEGRDDPVDAIVAERAAVGLREDEFRVIMPGAHVVA